MSFAAMQAEVEAGNPAPATILQIIDALDRGELRVALPPSDAQPDWQVQAWVKQAILFYFRQTKMKPLHLGPLCFQDQIPLKSRLVEQQIRLAPPGAIRYGAFLEPGCVVMPAYVNIGAYVGAGSLVDTWATVGSCAQIGRQVHLSGGVGIGGVLEPPQAAPVIVEDNAFIGSRCILVEGVRVGEGAVLAAGVCLTASTPIIDVRGSTPRTSRGTIPPRSIVLPGTRPKQYPAGSYEIPCALIVGERSAQTELKVSLNQALREFELTV
jgi:2,3,4,5-tetrahydropyridine-2-carboxylate N-succinyltransferase